MKHRYLATVATAVTLFLAPFAGLSFAQTTGDTICPNCPNNGVPKKDGTGGPGMKNKQQKGNQGKGNSGMRGNRTGPQDGTGPIHTPSGSGNRGGGGRGGRR